jgi:hypothetical protein
MSTKIRTTEKYRGYSRVHGADEYFESGGRGHNIYFTTKYRGQQRIFFHCLKFDDISTFRFKFGILGTFCNFDVKYCQEIEN